MRPSALGAWLAASLVSLVFTASCSGKQDVDGLPSADDDDAASTTGPGGGGPSDASGVSDDAPSGTTGGGSGSASGGSSGGGSGSGGSGAGPEAGVKPDSGSGSGSGSSSGAHDSGIDSGSSSGSGGGSGSGSGSGSSSGGSSPACTWSGALSYAGDASFTCYYFGQGTTANGGGYKTACGYGGTETVPGSGNSCGQSASDTVQNIADTGLAKSTYFAAIPGDANGNFSNVVHCGECAKLTNTGNGNSVIVTIIDECPISGSQNSPCKNAGHLDVSMQAFNALGYSSGDPSNTTWKSVPCPVTGTIQAVLNAGIAGQVYFQNTVFPVKSVSGATQSQYGYWQFNAGGAGGQATLTDVEGHSVTGTIPAGGGDMKVQFPSPGSCP
jgi:hypothetical protein